MDMPDDQLDFMIALALESQTVVPPQQQRSAWRRLRQRAILSPQLPPLEHPQHPIWQGIEALVHSLSRLLLADEIYHRAARNRPYSGGNLSLTLMGDLSFHYYHQLHRELART